MPEYLSFSLPDEFIQHYVHARPPWGFPIGGGNSLGELTFLGKYARRKPDGTKEHWHEVCRRVIEGAYSILKDHCIQNRTPWNEAKARRSAEDAYDRMFTFKWLPPGRGLWMMGTPFVHVNQNSAALQNCAMISTEKISSRSVHDAILPFTRLMEMSMLGVGVGFDTKGAGKLELHEPDPSRKEIFVIPDSREGWCESVAQLLESYFFENRPTMEFDYLKIRPAGAPIMGFGGVAAGPGPLEDLHQNLRRVLGGREGKRLGSRDIVDICNMIGKCVVAGNVRRSALLALGDPDDEEFLDLKNWHVNPERMGADGWGYTSNNCYRNDTRVVTREGVREIGLLAGRDDVELLTDNGQWVKAPVKSFGMAPLMKVTLSRSGIEKVLYATPNHRWFVEGNGNANGTRVEVRTENLRPGQYLTFLAGAAHNTRPEPSPFGIAHGIVFGDGTIHNGQAVVTLCGEKAADLLPWFPLAHATQDIRQGEWVGTRVRAGMPVSFKSLPDITENPSYLLGWVMGYFAADGTVGTNGSAVLSSADIKNLEFVREVCYLLGIPTSSIRCQRRFSEYTQQEEDQYSITFLSAGLVKEFFLRPKHRERFASQVRAEGTVNGGARRGRRSDLCWRVVSVEQTELVEEVYCATVPETQSFMLEDNILTGNSVEAEVGIDYSYLADRVVLNGEPGLIYTDLCRQYGRLIDPPTNRDYRVMGCNPCAEQSLESYELCTLVETFPINCDDLDDWIRTLKFAYLYGKAVTLLPTHWGESNEVMQRNRRIGCSVSGQAQFVEQYGVMELKEWLNAGYQAIVARDLQYSEWLGVRESIKKTSVKPSGTVSLVAGVTPGVHWPTGRGRYLRRVRYRVGDPTVAVLENAGYEVEPDVMDPKNTVVATFPVEGPDMRSEREVSVWEKMYLAVHHQRYWADNMVSLTASFREDECDQIPHVLRAFDGQLKSVSMLPLTTSGAYQQMPYEQVSDEVWEEKAARVRPINFAALYQNGAEAQGDRFCDSDKCELVIDLRTARSG